jgi:hypothetical protein
MKKITFTLFALTYSFIMSAQLTSAAPYCTPVYPPGQAYNMMKDFIIDGTVIQNFGVMQGWGAPTTFKYYNTTTLPTIAKGSSYSFSVNFYEVNDGEPIYFAVWIDYNKNNTFETSEIVMQNSNTTNAALPTFGGAVAPVTKTITIPVTATQGVTRMRIMRGSDEINILPYNPTFSLPSCHTIDPNSPNPGSYGCVYDFNVTIGPSLSTNDFNKESFKVYPNPVSNTLYFNNDTNTLISKVIIFNQLGQIVLTSNEKIDSGINVSELANGIYFAKLSTDSNLETNLVKFIKK